MERGRAVAKSFTRAYQCTRFGWYPVQHFCFGEHQRSMKAAVARGGQLEGRLIVRSKLGPASLRDLARSTVFASLWPFCALARIRIKWVAFLTSKIIAAKTKQVNSLVQIFRSDLESESQSKRKLLGSSSISLSFEITAFNPSRSQWDHHSSSIDGNLTWSSISNHTDVVRVVHYCNYYYFLTKVNNNSARTFQDKAWISNH